MTYLPGFENPVGYIVGIRQWIYSNGLLRSIIMQDYYWLPHETPKAIKADCGMFVFVGYYAAKPEHKELLAYSGVITGTVALWGEIHEHEKGYRAEYAYPLTLDHCSDHRVNLDELRELYLKLPTDKTRAIAEERKRWILERKKEHLQSSQSASRQQALSRQLLYPPGQNQQNQLGRQALYNNTWLDYINDLRKHG